MMILIVLFFRLFDFILLMNCLFVSVNLLGPLLGYSSLTSLERDWYFSLLVESLDGYSWWPWPKEGCILTAHLLSLDSVTTTGVFSMSWDWVGLIVVYARGGMSTFLKTARGKGVYSLSPSYSYGKFNAFILWSGPSLLLPTTSLWMIFFFVSLY